jgi:hypothetical protein
MKLDPVSSQQLTGKAKRVSATVDALFLLRRGSRLKAAAKFIASTGLQSNPNPIHPKHAVILSERGPERFSVRGW